MRQIIQKIINKLIISVLAIVSVLVTLVTFFLFCFMSLWILSMPYMFLITGGIQFKPTIHKVMNYDDYNIIIATKTNGFFLPTLYIYLDIWVDGKKIKSYPLYDADTPIDYNHRIKNVTLLPNSNEIKVEFNGNIGLNPVRGKGRVSVATYKIVDD